LESTLDEKEVCYIWSTVFVFILLYILTVGAIK